MSKKKQKTPNFISCLVVQTIPSKIKPETFDMIVTLSAKDSISDKLNKDLRIELEKFMLYANTKINEK